MHTIDPATLLFWSLIPLLAAFALGAIDGIYFHLERFRLFAQAETRREHCLHTVRAFLVLPALGLLYLVEARGLALQLAALAVAADVGVMLADLAEERRSRLSLGGLPHAEYVVHVIANGLHAVALALAFASRPPDAWSPSAPMVAPSGLPFAAWLVVALLFLSAVGATLQHVVLWHRHRPGAAGATAPIRS
jgi:hypothetical protein